MQTSGLWTYQLGFSEVTSRTSSGKPRPTRGELRRLMTRWRLMWNRRSSSGIHGIKLSSRLNWLSRGAFKMDPMYHLTNVPCNIPLPEWLQLPITRTVSICHSEMKKWSEKIQTHCSKSKIHKDKILPPKQLLEHAEFRSTGSILKLLVNKHTKQQVFLPDAFNWGQLNITYVFLLRWTCSSCSISRKESSAEKMATIPNPDNWTGSLTWTFLARIANPATNQRPTLDELD